MAGSLLRCWGMRVLVAFDKFKDALTAPAACEIAREVLSQARPDWSLETCPLADGGEGFATILTSAAGGEWHPVDVTGPRERPVRSGFGLVELERLPDAARAMLQLPGVNRLGVIEMATASGIESLHPKERDPWQTTSLGTGEAIRAAFAAGAEAVLLGVGGSATNDVGIGALDALGWQAQNAAGDPVSVLTPSGWSEIASFQPAIKTLPPIRIACDVANPLLGERGATSVFGPQKGLLPADQDALESEVVRVAKLLGQAAGRPGRETTPGAGAAGGIAYGFLVAAEAQLVPGFDLVEAWLGIESKLAVCDLVITGEGRFDQSSLEGKGPGSLLRRARTAGKDVWILAGAITLDAPPPNASVLAITPEGMALPEALRLASENLATALRRKLVE